MKLNVPQEILSVVKTLQAAGFEAFIVGGCVRDIIIGNIPKDWDVTTNATPEKVEGLFEKTFYDNDFGMVGVVNEGVEDEALKIVEVTTYRIESEYSNNRHPDSVKFSETLEEDLQRRDFTMNAIAYDTVNEKIVDLYEGQEAIGKKEIHAVGNPDERFKEDALRILRAIRFSSQLGFTIGSETLNAMERDAHLLANISKERIRDEFLKILDSSNPSFGLGFMQKLNILRFVIPELEETIGCDQNRSHIYDVWEHSVRALQHSADKGLPTYIRLSALLHDIGKPRTKQYMPEKKENTFYGHEVVGANMARKICKDLRLPKDFSYKVVLLVRHHMFFSDPDEITLSAVRRLIAKVGKEHIWDLINLRMSDRIGMGRPKEEPYRLRKFESMIEEVMRDPVTVGMLKIDGGRLIEMGEDPGRRIGNILHSLLEEVLDDPKKNTKEYLENRSNELQSVTEEELKKLGEKGREVLEDTEESEIKKIQKKYKV